MCHNFGDGRVHIAFYRQPIELDFAKVLVHESVHGYLHRHRSHPHVPSWANEGLAEVISSQLVRRPGYEQQARSDARSHLQQSGGLNRRFFEERIEPWGYPIAETLCEFMISQNKKGYVEFINGMKDGLSWEESLQTRYGTTLDRLIPAYTSWLGIRSQ